MGRRHGPASRFRKLEPSTQTFDLTHALHDGTDQFLFQCLQLRLQIPLDITGQGGHETDDFLFADLETPSDSVVRRAGKDTLVDQIAGTPGFGEYVHVLMLQRGCQNQVLSTADETARLGAADVFSAAEDHEIGSVGR